eukprot:359678-Chlamydomonas_euryale.AAC.1
MQPRYTSPPRSGFSVWTHIRSSTMNTRRARCSEAADSSHAAELPPASCTRLCSVPGGEGQAYRCEAHITAACQFEAASLQHAGVRPATSQRGGVRPPSSQRAGV